MRALIDGDILVYRLGFAVEKKWYLVFEEGSEDYGFIAQFRYKKEALEYVGDDDTLYLKEEVDVEPVSHALHLVNNMIDTILEETGSDSYTVYLTGKNNFRDTAATIMKYKDRPDRKPVHYAAIRDYLLIKYNAELSDGHEADDELAMAQYKALGYEDTVICGIDKDLLMIPGHHYNIAKREMFQVDEGTGYLNFFRQMLQGDATDTIPGLYKLTGEKCKKKYLETMHVEDTPEAMEQYVKDVYFEACGKDAAYWKYLDFTALPEIARLLWMSREEIDDCPFFKP